MADDPERDDLDRLARRYAMGLRGDALRWEKPRIVSTRGVTAGTPKPKGWER
jgi:hypothetical protein